MRIAEWRITTARMAKVERPGEKRQRKRGREIKKINASKTFIQWPSALQHTRIMYQTVGRLLHDHVMTTFISAALSFLSLQGRKKRMDPL